MIFIENDAVYITTADVSQQLEKMVKGPRGKADSVAAAKEINADCPYDPLNRVQIPIRMISE